MPRKKIPLASSSTPPPPSRRRRKGQRPTAAEKQQLKERFLEAFVELANVTTAAKVVGTNRWTIYRWIEVDEAFAKTFHQAEDVVNDTIRAEIFRRAVEGVDKPLYNQGRLVQRKVVDEDGTEHYEDVTVKEYSDPLLIFLAKARMPEFRDKSQVDVHATIDIQAAAAEADRKFTRLITLEGARSLLGEPDAS